MKPHGIKSKYRHYQKSKEIDRKGCPPHSWYTSPSLLISHLAFAYLNSSVIAPTKSPGLRYLAFEARAARLGQQIIRAEKSSFIADTSAVGQEGPIAGRKYRAPGAYDGSLRVLVC